MLSPSIVYYDGIRRHFVVMKHAETIAREDDRPSRMMPHQVVQVVRSLVRRSACTVEDTIISMIMN